MQMGRADKMGLPFRKLALGFQGMPQKQRFAYDKPENRVAQKLQLLVIYDFTARGSFLLSRPRTVGERPVQRIRALKVVSQERFQCGYVRLLHDRPAGAPAL